MMERRISVISVNYNGYSLTCAMIDSLRRHVTTPLEIVIVDNGSARDEAAPLRERYPDVKVLRSERNLGFAGGNNLGFAAATGDYLLLLNNDTEVTEDTAALPLRNPRRRPLDRRGLSENPVFRSSAAYSVRGLHAPDAHHAAQRPDRLRRT